MQAVTSAEPESLYAWLRLAASLALMTLGGVAMYGVTVALPAVQAAHACRRIGGKIEPRGARAQHRF